MIRNASYRRTQIGWAMIGVIGVVGVIGVASVVSAPSTAGFVSSSIVLLCLVFFSTLTVVTDDEGIGVRFGPGPLIRRRLRWSQIRSSHVVRNSWMNGIGIRWIGSGWMFNVSGLDAVELTLDNGRRFRIGTNDPSGLDSFIRGRLAARSGGSAR
ncbi:MAG TPA: hypothetical protein VNO30_30160 [Kofleriaceae bacterium]|nr:hypothetical protein [Kofleriaceae bacterium]